MSLALNYSSNGNSLGYLDDDNNFWLYVGRELDSFIKIFNFDNSKIFMKVNTGDCKVKTILIRNQIIFVLDQNDNLWVCGRNELGQLGLGNRFNHRNLTQVKLSKSVYVENIFSVGGGSNYIIDNNGSIWRCGNNLSDDPCKINETFTKYNINNVKFKSIYFSEPGGYYFYALDEEGNIWACGINKYGNLGLGDCDTRVVPTKVEISENPFFVLVKSYSDLSCPIFFTIVVALDNNGNIWYCDCNTILNSKCCNCHECYQHRNNYVPTNKFIKLKLDNDPYFVDVKHNNKNQTFALDDQGKIWSCGYDNYGLINGKSPHFIYHYARNRSCEIYPDFTQIVTNNVCFKSIFCNELSFFAIDHQGGLWCCGYNCDYQLGLGRFKGDFIKGLQKVSIDGDPNIIDVIPNDHFTCLIDSTNNIWISGLIKRGFNVLKTTYFFEKTDFKIKSNSRNIKSANY